MGINDGFYADVPSILRQKNLPEKENADILRFIRESSDESCVDGRNGPSYLDTRCEIVNGPSQGTMLAQLGDIGRIPLDDRPTFNIQVKPWISSRRGELKVLIKGLESLDDEGEMWKLKVYVVGGDRFALEQITNLERFIFFQVKPWLSLECEYNSRTRKGWVRVAP